MPQRGGYLILGDGTHVCRQITFTVATGATLSLGSNTFIGPGVVISAHKKVLLGSDCLIAEYVSIYDNDHVTSNIDLPISKQGYVYEPCIIENGCWIGAGARILRGAGLGRNCILGAGSVLKKTLPNNVVAVGVPARVIKKRSDSEASFVDGI